MSDADDWIAALPEPRRTDIATIDARIRAVAPDEMIAAAAAKDGAFIRSGGA